MEVYITKAAKFFPNSPVSNEDMESYLGKINGTPSRARRIILSNNGIKQRYYACSREGISTHTNSEMAANAVRGLLDDSLTVDDLDILSCGTASPDQTVPSHGVMVHGQLGGNADMEVVSFAGSCLTGVDALKYAYMAIKSGLAHKAAVSASERLSAWLRASYFQTEGKLLSSLENNPMLAFQKEFLRWMLSDGALAVLLEEKPGREDISLRIDWIEITSFANSHPTCMYAGADIDSDGSLKGWADFTSRNGWTVRSLP